MILKTTWRIISIACYCLPGVLSSQRKYDGSALTYDPKGRMFQVEYAMEATRRGRTVVGVCGEGCVVLVTRGPSPLVSCRAVVAEDVWAVDSHVSLAASGLRSDVQYVADCARTWCSEHHFVFGAPMPCHMLTRRLADLVHSCTTRGGKRPLAVDILVAGVDEHAGASLHRIQATGAFQRYRAVAVGGSEAAANAQLANPPAWVDLHEKQGFPGEGCDRTDNQQADGAAGAAVGEEMGGRNMSVEGDCSDDNSSGCDGDGGSSSTGPDPARDNRGTVDEHRLPDQRPRRRRSGGKLMPGHRTALKQALAALWETTEEDPPQSAYEGNRPSAAAATDAELIHGGLKASELSVTMYGTQRASEGEDDGGGDRNGISVWSGEEGNEGCQWMKCSTEDCEDILLELERDEMDARRMKGCKKLGRCS